MRRASGGPRWSSRTSRPSRSASRASEAARRLREADAVFRALAHPSRRQIILVLRFRGGEMTAGEIAERFSCAWPTTTRHLGVLEMAGVIVAEKRGRERLYRLDRRRLREVVGGWLRWLEGPIGATGRRVRAQGVRRRR